MSSEDLAIITMYGAGGCALVAIVAPWVALLLGGRRAAAATAAVLALTATALSLVSNANMPARFNIRVDLVIILPLLLAAWLECICLAILAARRKSRGVKSDA